MTEPRENERARARDALLMQTPERWPFRVILPLAHRSRVDAYGSPVCAVLALGQRTRVYFANVQDFERGELQSRAAFEAALRRFESVPYLSFEAIAREWRVD